MAVKINKLEIENVKRVKAVAIEPTPNGLTVIGGNNGQGKTSVLDAIAWALGGNKYKPTKAQREGSVTPPSLQITMNNGLIVKRDGKNSSLKVIDPTGRKAGQQLLNEFVEELAINLPKFLEASDKEKAETLLQIIGVSDELFELDSAEARLYNDRRAIGQIADQKKKFALEKPYYTDAPDELVSVSELIQQQQAILARNGENQRKREQVTKISQDLDLANQIVNSLKKQLQEAEEKQAKLQADLEVAHKSAADLKDESTAELEKQLAEIDEINRRVRANLDKEKAESDAKEFKEKYDSLTAEIEEIRAKRTDLLSKADLPLPGLSVMDGKLTYNNQQWDNMSSSEQLRVATAIVRKLKPDCGFVLLDKLEQMDLQTMNNFGKWLEQEGLQGIATRVSTGDECEIIIEDGYVVKDTLAAPKQPTQSAWTGKGAF
ncbi:AAA family ATPase [Ligilactobacillus agilis]|uniref:AAA family ATPase n=1 Tax=Ligilactobacillus agilis TaxID=1601 RepID=UPI003F88E1C2